MQTQTCKNCAHTYEGKFCNQCGQAVAHRLDLHHIFHEAVHVFTHADKGIFPFIPTIVTKPGIVARDYVEGRRKKYFNLFQYLILVAGLSTFLMAKSHYMDQLMEVLTQQSTPTGVPPKMAALQKNITEFTQKYMTALTFCLLPIYALFSWLLFRKSGMNYAENIVFHVALQSGTNTLNLFLVYPLFFALNAATMGMGVLYLPVLVMLFIFIVGTRQFFQVSWFTAAWKIIAVYVLTFLVQTLITAIITIFLLLTSH